MSFDGCEVWSTDDTSVNRSLDKLSSYATIVVGSLAILLIIDVVEVKALLVEFKFESPTALLAPREVLLL